MDDFLRQRLLEGNVADDQLTAGLQHPQNLAKDLRLIGGEVDHTVTDHAVNRCIRQGQLVDLGQMELDIGGSDQQPRFLRE